MIYFFSDPHFNHVNILHLCGRPFANIEEMDTAIINNYNAVIKENDEVYFLGDVAWKDAKLAVNTLRRLNVSKRYLLIGNHDHKNIKTPNFVKCFDWIKDYYELTYNSRLYILSHYPFHSWRNSGRGSIMCAGHTHNKIDNSNCYRIDCGVDNPQCNFAPISINKIETIMKEKHIIPKY